MLFEILNMYSAEIKRNLTDEDAQAIFIADCIAENAFTFRMCVSVLIFAQCISDTMVPFGGMKQSGFGRENGTAALEAFSQIKSVFVNASNSLENPFQ